MRAPVLLALLAGAACAACASLEPVPRPSLLDEARAVGSWLVSVGRPEPGGGTSWPADPERPDARPTTLYSGSAGVVLFLLELHRFTGEARWLEHAGSGADHLAASLPERFAAPGSPGEGLYTGLAGVGFALAETYRSTGDERYRVAAVRCCELLHEGAIQRPAGVAWSDTTDVVSGSAGAGFFLLYSAARLGRSQDLGLAARAGRHLLAVAEEAEGGLRWRMDPSSTRLMPNFSHGTAGVAAFLAALHRATGDGDFHAAAAAGARHLLAIGECGGGLCRVHHHAPGGEDLFYVGFCHGPAGTARLFDELARGTRRLEWREWRRSCGRSVLASGIPERQVDGFWNNVGQCCGSAGIAEFLLDLNEDLGQEEFRELADRLTADLLARGARDERGLRWVHAEHRARPELLQAQTGYMQGAAGVGLWLLHDHAARVGRGDRIRLPDDPKVRRP